MNSSNLHKSTKISVLSGLLAALALSLQGCDGKQDTPPTDPGAGAGDVLVAQPAAVTIDCSNSVYPSSPTGPVPAASIQCPEPPDNPPQAAGSGSATQASLYEDWAWKSFIALNWPAIEPTANNGFLRGFPDQTVAFGNAGDANVTPVWSTWKEKREIFSLAGSTPPAWSSEYDYQVSYPACAGQESAVAASANPRVFSQVSKGNSLDESVEVPSQAGQNVGVVSGGVVEPRLWRGTRAADNAVIYEVKLNYNYYDYVVSNQLYNDTTRILRQSLSGDPTVSGGQAASAVNFPKRAYDSQTPANSYSAAACASSDATPANGATPCDKIGTIQTKSAWVKITPSEAASGTYHWTDAFYYESVPVSATYPDGLCMTSGQFGLIGFHIIQKTHNQGHYIYATWERKNPGAYIYANYSAGTTTPPVTAGFYPATGGITVARDHAILASTAATNATYQALLSNSVWSNYDLIGVQYVPVQADSDGANFTNGSNDPTNNGQPFYLANLFLETNWGLQNFQGVPPGQANGTTAAAYTPVNGFLNSYTNANPPVKDNSLPADTRYAANNSTTFERGFNNLGHDRRGSGRVYNMGGCMGCHGVAQANGADFSFVLFKGQNGADVEPINGAP